MKYNFEFINHQQITTKFLWNDGIHLLDTGKSILGQNFVNRVSNFFPKNDSFLTDPHFQEKNLAKSRLKEMKDQSSDKLILGHLNINSIRNKFEVLKFIIGNNIDIFLISETKLDDSFPTAQFLIKGFSAHYRLDRNSKGGGLLLYIREDIPSKILTCSSNCDIVEIS